MEHQEIVGPGLRELFALINLLIVVAIIYFAGRRGISASLKERSLTISKRLVEAKVELEKMKLEAERVRREVADIDQQKKKIIASVSEEGNRMAMALLKDARVTADRILSDAKLAAENETRSAGTALREKLVSEALAQSVQMIKANTSSGNELKNQIHEKLFEKFIAEVPENLTPKKEASNGN